MKLRPATGDALFVLLYDTKSFGGVREEYYAYFSSEEEALKAWSKTFENDPLITLVGIAKMISYTEKQDE